MATHESSDSSNSKVDSRPTLKKALPEKILICLDVSHEMDSELFGSRAGERFNTLKALKRSLRLWVRSKAALGEMHGHSHSFALALWHDNFDLITDWTSNPEHIIEALDSVERTVHCENNFRLSVLFSFLEQTARSSLQSGNYVFHAILCYGRSHCSVQWDDATAFQRLVSSPLFFCDVLYAHEPTRDRLVAGGTTTPSDNQCHEIYQQLNRLDARDVFYVLEAARSANKLYSRLAQLLAHPQQRVPQASARYTLAGPAPQHQSATSVPPSVPAALLPTAPPPPPPTSSRPPLPPPPISELTIERSSRL